MIIHPYENIKISLLTKHQKEKVIAPKFLKMFDAEIIHTDDFDTDELGTFTRDRARYGNQLDAARRKARIGMEITGLKYGIASEGSFTSDPFVGMLPWNHEIIIFIDDVLRIEIIGSSKSAAISSQLKIRNWKELAKFARLNKFPRHQLVIRPDDENHPVFQKGISNRLMLEEAFNQAMKLSKTKRVFVEHDLRAFANPTRMKNIGSATNDLINKLKTLCPKCHTPGFQITKVKSGLPCSICDMETREIMEKIFTCNKCHYEKSEFVKKVKADPAKCDFCNP
jgi:hypothetical protein